MTEADFISTLRHLATAPAARGLADDCAVLDIGNETLVLTYDMLAEGVHYLPDQDMADVAWKLVATNLSDLAAKGASPVGVLLGFMLGDNDDRFASGLAEVLATYDVPLLGGDTVSAPGAPRVFGLTALGTATHCPPPSRAGAQPGDAVWITGPVGGAMMGLEALRASNGAGTDSTAYRRPTPLLAEGQALAPLVTAMMDVSDGLLLDASRIGTASGVTLAIDSKAVPIAAPEDRRADALRWGDDYQLLFTMPTELTPPVSAVRIGTVERDQGDGPLLIDGRVPAADRPLGYRHQHLPPRHDAPQG
ncbi:thiamine-phosphate kinase [Tsuneonella suprasediminis]|uniref:Thiamine-monophosphate kinase n=1 Tax=Tsuneonella suprasediminis TaxID=2306996 RepID=A0A419R315_9SPHN|nr:thiamine-phosphate kinase [Tsuneonella suprasediminis]RJX68541.1 thiamine-phosphate kinase [Tsuneonella suprasediminis]